MGKLLAEGLVRDVPDFPKPGILFKDITPVVQNHAALKEIVTLLADGARGRKIDTVLGIEARGFIFGAPVALNLGVGFVPLRKLGKLPFDRVTEQYDLVLVDTPPANLIADVQLLAASCDAVLLVARAFSTTRKAFEKAVQELLPFRVIGTVLNAGMAQRYGYGGY